MVGEGRMKLYILMCSVDYEDTSVLGVFDTIANAEKARIEAIDKGPLLEGEQRTLRKNADVNAIDISDNTFYIEEFELNIKKRNW